MALPTQQAASLFDEFKNFAFKGNVIDLAVGVIIGSAFGKIVSSMVDNLIMPVLSVVMPGDASYKDWVLKVGEKTIPYGAFLGDVVSFLILATAPLHFYRQVSGVDHAIKGGRSCRTSRFASPHERPRTAQRNPGSPQAAGWLERVRSLGAPIAGRSLRPWPLG